MRPEGCPGAGTQHSEILVCPPRASLLSLVSATPDCPGNSVRGRKDEPRVLGGHRPSLVYSFWEMWQIASGPHGCCWGAGNKVDFSLVHSRNCLNVNFFIYVNIYLPTSPLFLRCRGAYANLQWDACLPPRRGSTASQGTPLLTQVLRFYFQTLVSI